MAKFICIILLTVLSFAKERVEIFAKDVILENNTTLIAKNSVILLYDNNLIKADKITYNKETSTLFLEGSVEMLGKDTNRLSSNTLKIDTLTKEVEIDSIFLAGEDNLWIDASSAIKGDNIYRLKNSKISSCNKLNPDWTIEFTQADYYSDKEVITMEDAKVRFYNTTILYLPYLAFPTVHKRKTGLLYPRFKITARDGIVYEQPLYYASSPNWDLELNPQFRLKRGAGAFFTARFIDSNQSNGYFRVGYFKNSHTYAKNNNLKDEHKGFELFYQSRDFIPENWYLRDYKSGFYLNSTYLSDREYLNLQKNSVSSLVKSNLVESRLNSFLYNSNHYFGIYGKYNIDISKENNNRTIQDMPSLQYHSFLQNLLEGKLFYSFDTKLHNFTRTQGSRATQAEIDLPITYYDSFFNHYLNLSLSENLYLNRVDFSNINSKYRDYYYYYRNYHKIDIFSDLTKQYKDFSHTIYPKLTYIVPSIQKEKPFAYRYLANEKKELFVTYTQEEQLSLSLEEYFNNGLNMGFMHSIGYSYYPNRLKSKGDIINELEYNRDNLNLYNNIKYSKEEEQIYSTVTSLRYNQSNYDIMLTHFYNSDFLFDNKQTSFIQSKFINHYTDKDSYFISFDYDLKQNFNHQWNIGWTHKQKCWSSKISIGQEVVPNFDNSFRNTALYLELNLNPIGGIQQNIENSFSSQGVNN